jgi:hypothetical protein
MIEAYAASLAAKMGIELSKVSIVDGKLLGCRDSHLLQLHSDDHIESALVYQRELEDLHNGINRDGLERRIRAALSRLRIMLESS